MIQLTVGYVSGIIAAAIFILQKFIPMAIALIMVGVAGQDNSAVTWSVCAQTIGNSLWPKILRTDSSASLEVNGKVKLVNLLRPLALGLVAVAAVVTPLGLYETVAPARSLQTVPFPYIADTGPMGYGTPPRSSLGFSRKCGAYLPVVCPGSDTIISYSNNATTNTADLPNGYDTRIPKHLTDLFQSGLTSQPQTMSSIFDIEWRTYTFDQDPNIDNGEMYLVNSFRQLTSLILNNAIEPVEGLIVDTQAGGVGFRNHTIPSGVELGATWTEDLLFIVPETQCVDTNLTLDFSIPQGMSLNGLDDFVLTDRGGFANMIQKYPHYDRSDPQANPDLTGRAYKAAWMNNALTMLYLNVTRPNPDAWSYLDSKVGKRFPLTVGLSDISYDSLIATSDWGTFLDFSTSNATSSNSSGSANAAYANPFQISSSNFSDIGTICQGAGALDLANITNIAVNCGMVFGAARRQDGSDSLIFAPGTKWTVPMYSCATATKAVIKEVNFLYNGTQGLKSLNILNATEKAYASDDDKPLWGVENTALTLGDASALWGLVSPDYQGRSDVSTVRSSHLWLPGYTGLSFGVFTFGYQNLPGVEFHTDALGGAYVAGTSLGAEDMVDYSGKSNLAMYAKWQEFSKFANTTANIINLIWTDISANAVVGTKSWLPSLPLVNLQQRDITTNTNASSQQLQQQQQQQTVQVPVQIYTHQIHYKYLFAIPACIVVLLTAFLSLTAFFLMIFRRARPSEIREFLNALSPGRIMTTFVYPEECDQQAPTTKWVRQVGHKRVVIGSGAPHRPSQLLLGKDGTQILMRPLGTPDAPGTPPSSAGGSYHDPQKMESNGLGQPYAQPYAVPAYNFVQHQQTPAVYNPRAPGFHAR
jgi:hypothetical protein